MDFLVGLWSVPTHSTPFSRATLASRCTTLENAVQQFAGKLGNYAIPGGQKIRGIFVAPEYFLSHRFGDHFNPTNNTVIERTISYDEKEAFVQTLRGVSRDNPGVLLIPGTIAWKKTFERQDSQNFKRDPRTHQRTLVPKDSLTDRRVRLGNELDYFINLDGGHQFMRQARERFEDRSRPVTGGGTSSTVGMHVPSVAAKRDLVSGKTTVLVTDPSTGTLRGIVAPQPVPYYMRNTAYVFLDNEVLYKYHKKGDFFESINTTDHVFVPSMKSPVVPIAVDNTNNLRFGFEICLDHNIGMLGGFISKQALNTPHVHVVCSAAVQNNTAKMHTVDGGFFIHASSYQPYTVVYGKRGGTMVQMTALETIKVGGWDLGIWRIRYILPEEATFLTNVRNALDRYNREKTIAASKESKNALAVLRRLVNDEDVNGLRAHLNWYLGRVGALQPVGAGAKIPAGKRFATLLTAAYP
ncbi:hypothetical protein HL658_17085 [Azospirillum sp. RWY-5-1]|uniref:CN hydrolase domain-containing protein n=1 Tax=Azospirillum oleiclasticum TaxID=2735135 RepID=A0ABX2TF13_9PROT|nr:hypothetical protein [Azospirillum oleiclasticum]NYZ14273.1 hypothetical protein [Azospirillum oleiclasticum]NYZ21758.1 hypothetical protein [Azospirillum oleiclasticum]